MKDKTYKVLRCGDQLFWAYRFLADEHIKYSKHDMEYVKHDEVRYDSDLIYIHSPDISRSHSTTIPKIAHSKGIKVIGAYAGSPVFWSPAEKRNYDYADLIVTISPQTYEFAKFHYDEYPVIFLPESVDTNVFYPDYNKLYSTEKKELIIGWAGGAHKKIKRTHLLAKLDFPVKIKSDWKEQRRHGIKTNTHMKEFYQSLDVLVVTSLSECMPRVILEAMACGLPVISTDCGGVRMLIDREMLVPIHPEEDCVTEMNTRLHMFYKYPELRKAIGIRNRKHIEEYWSWTKNVTLWDDVFSLVIENKVDEAIIIADKYLENYREDFDYLRKRFRRVHIDKPEESSRDTFVRITTKDAIKNLEKHETISSMKPTPVLSPKQQALYDVVSSNIDCWILKDTCLDCVRYNGEKLKSSRITFGVNNIVDRMDIINDLEDLDWKKANSDTVSKDGIAIEIIIDPERKTKVMALLDIQVLAPIPILKYLKDTFGTNWENLK